MANELSTLFQYVMDNYLDAKQKSFSSSNEVTKIVTNDIVSILSKEFPFETYIIAGSVGKGNWTHIPWIVILNKQETTTPQEGVYVVYLFSEDMNRLYLTLNQGVARVEGRGNKRKVLQERAKEIRDKIYMPALKIDNEISLGNGNSAKNYEAGAIGYIEYKKNELPKETKLLEDLREVLNYYQKYLEGNTEEIDMEKENEKQLSTSIEPKDLINNVNNFLSSQGFSYSKSDIANYFLSLKTKPFVILAGISGTGKSKLTELFAQAVGANRVNGRFTLIPVRSDWNDSSDLLGYVNLEGNFQPGPLTQVINTAQNDPDNPYFVCLDEMNLSRVEYYFSEFLSIMETRARKSDEIVTDVLMKEESFNNESDSKEYGNLRIPENLYLVGTVNMDETTHPFSKKVLDRANTIEFSQVDLDAYKDANNIEMEPLELTNSFFKTSYLNLKECLFEHAEYVEKIVNKLKEINSILSKASQHVGYRIRDEFCYYVAVNKEMDLLDEDKAFDYQLMQKILPRLQGSSRRLFIVLVELFELCTGKNFANEDGEIGDKIEDYLYENRDNITYPLSAEKIAQMIRRHEEDGFTSFWA